jgi:hypothetical protein
VRSLREIHKSFPYSLFVEAFRAFVKSAANLVESRGVSDKSFESSWATMFTMEMKELDVQLNKSGLDHPSGIEQLLAAKPTLPPGQS